MPGAKARIRLDGADPINRGLIAFWPLADGGGNIAQDIAPRRRHGAITGFTTNRSSAGQNAKVLTFDGSNDYIAAGGRWLAGLSRASVACRFRPNAGGGQIYYEDGGGFNNFSLPCPAPGTSAITINIGSNTARNTTSRTWVASTWYDIVVTWGADIRIYINGVLDTTIAVAVTTASGAGDNDQIGRYSFGGGVAGGYTPASLSAIRLFNRVLVPGEVARLYRDTWAGTSHGRLPIPFVYPPLTATITGEVPVTAAIAAELESFAGGVPHGVLRRGRRGRVWQDVPEELKPVVALAEEWSEADPVARAVEEALAKHARITLRTSAARRARLMDEAKRAVIAAVERAAELDDEEALIALL